MSRGIGRLTQMEIKTSIDTTISSSYIKGWNIYSTAYTFTNRVIECVNPANAGFVTFLCINNLNISIYVNHLLPLDKGHFI